MIVVQYQCVAGNYPLQPASALLSAPPRRSVPAGSRSIRQAVRSLQAPTNALPSKEPISSGGSASV
jgi:hypothetical protein